MYTSKCQRPQFSLFLAQCASRGGGNLTAIARAESSEHSANDHEHAANHDDGLTSEPIGQVGRDEEGQDGTDIVDVDQDTELVGVHVLGEELLPEVHLLGRVEQHAIVAGGRGADEQEDGQEVELAQMRLLVPGDLLEPGRIGLGGVDVLGDLLLNEVLRSRHHDGRVLLLRMTVGLSLNGVDVSESETLGRETEERRQQRRGLPVLYKNWVWPQSDWEQR